MIYEIYEKNENSYKILLSDYSFSEQNKIKNQIKEKSEQNGWKLKEVVQSEINMIGLTQDYFDFGDPNKSISFLVCLSEHNFSSNRAYRIREFVWHLLYIVPDEVKQKDTYCRIANSICFFPYANTKNDALDFPLAEETDWLSPIPNYIWNEINENKDYRNTHIVFADDLNEWFASTDKFLIIPRKQEESIKTINLPQKTKSNTKSMFCNFLFMFINLPGLQISLIAAGILILGLTSGVGLTVVGTGLVAGGVIGLGFQFFSLCKKSKESKNNQLVDGVPFEARSSV